MIIGIDANEANVSTRVGINQYAFDLLHALSSSKSKHDFIIYLKTNPLSDLPPEKIGWKYRIIPFPKLWTQTRLPWDLYAHSPRPDVFLSLTHYAPRWSPVPTVVTIMDLGFLKTPEQFTKKDFNQLKSWTGYSVRQAKKIIAISNFTKLDLMSAFNLPDANIAVSYPSYDSKLFKPTKDIKVLEQYGIKSPYLLFLSSLKPSKNVEGLIKAFSTLSFKRLTLVIAGKKGWLYDKIFDLVKELKLEKRIIFTGFVAESDVPVLMTMAECYVLPSFHEGFGIPVLEAMACGTPVVTSNIASLPEVAGEAGIFINPTNIQSIREGIETALANRQKFAQLGLKRVKSFSWTKSASEILAVLESTP